MLLGVNYSTGAVFNATTVPISSGSDHFRFRSFPVTFISGYVHFRFRSVAVPISSGSDHFSGYSHFRFRPFAVPISSDSDPFQFRSLPVPITSVPIISGYAHFAPLDYGDCDLSIHLSVNLEFSNTADKSSLIISKLHRKMLLLHYALLHYAK